jgi:hypothetical protein
MSYLATFIAVASSIKIKASDVGLPTSTTTIAQGLANILNLLISVIGSVSVIMIVVGGLMYAASTGDPGRVKRAHDTIVYAIVGLIVAIVAFAVVNFVAFALRG